MRSWLALLLPSVLACSSTETAYLGDVTPENGQVLQEGISEAGGISSWIAAGTSYSVNDVPMLPFFFYYAMFGFQRVGCRLTNVEAPHAGFENLNC